MQRAERAEAQALAQRARLRIEPIPESDPESDIVEGAAIEYRRTIAWIRFCSRQINELENDRDVIFGMTSRSDTVETSSETAAGTEAGEDKDVETKRETRRAIQRFDAKINGWVEILNWNRTHLDRQISRWLQYGLDVRRLQLEEAMIDAIVNVVGFVVRELGRDPADPGVRAIIKRAFDQLDFGHAADEIAKPKPRVIDA